MLRPTADTSVALGSPLTIFYRHSLGARAPVAIDISANNGSTWRTVAETRTTGSITSSFRWVVDLLPVPRARVRIRALDGSGARDVSRAFSVTAPAAQAGMRNETVPGGRLPRDQSVSDPVLIE